MNEAIKEVVDDRIVFLEADLDFPELMYPDDVEVLHAELAGLRAELAADKIGDEIEDVIQMYEGRDGYVENARWRRGVNRGLAEAGRLEKFNPDSVCTGPRPTMQFKGERYYKTV